MKPLLHELQLLDEQATSLYNAEKGIQKKIDNLLEYTQDCSQRVGLSREADENRNHCVRLEGILVLISRMKALPDTKQSPTPESIQQIALTLKRIGLKHAAFGYGTSMLLALISGDLDLVRLLEQATAEEILSTV